MSPPDWDVLRRALGVSVSDEALRHALSHSSYAYENGGEDNERLEFLGDAVLGQSVTALLYRHYPDLPEGELAKRRAAVVSTHALARVATDIGLGHFLLLGRGEERTEGRAKPSLLADALEAVIGAVFIEQGHQAADDVVVGLMGEMMRDPRTFDDTADPKTALQELAASRALPPPRYVLSEDGPDHQKTFTADAFIDCPQHSPGPVGRGVGSSKKLAEIDAARNALGALRGS